MESGCVSRTPLTRAVAIIPYFFFRLIRMPYGGCCLKKRTAWVIHRRHSHRMADGSPSRASNIPTTVNCWCSGSLTTLALKAPRLWSRMLALTRKLQFGRLMERRYFFSIDRGSWRRKLEPPRICSMFPLPRSANLLSLDRPSAWWQVYRINAARSGQFRLTVKG